MLYPYRFRPILVERVWGNATLARYGKAVSAGQHIGESWEITDRPEAESVVTNGPLIGTTLQQLIAQLGEQLLGTAAAHAKRFPLLIKLLDCRERLSLQVHPPAALAAKLNGEPKTEMWYVMDADPGAHLIAGLRRGVTRERFAAAIRQQPSPLEKLVHRFPVSTSDALFVPSGRLHAIDAGLVIAEIQQNSDTTYRVCDWDRVGLDGKPRALHIDQSLACIDFADVEPAKASTEIINCEGNGLRRLAACDHFVVHELIIRKPWPDRTDGTSFQILGCMASAVELTVFHGVPEQLRAGEFILLPAGLGEYVLTPQDEHAHVLKAFLPAPNHA